MRATRRHGRSSERLASPKAVTSILAQLRAALPEIIPRRDKDLILRLRAARHLQRYAATYIKRGRLSQWKPEDLLGLSARLSEILERETSTHLSLTSFVIYCKYLTEWYFRLRLPHLFDAPV